VVVSRSNFLYTMFNFRVEFCSFSRCLHVCVCVYLHIYIFILCTHKHIYTDTCIYQIICNIILPILLTVLRHMWNPTGIYTYSVKPNITLLKIACILNIFIKADVCTMVLIYIWVWRPLSIWSKINVAIQHGGRCVTAIPHSFPFTPHLTSR
jgi:hypothetical protein